MVGDGRCVVDWGEGRGMGVHADMAGACLDWSVGTREDTAHAKVRMCAHLAKWSQLLNVDKLFIHVAQRKVPMRHLLEQLLVVVETCRRRRVRARKCERVRA